MPKPKTTKTNVGKETAHQVEQRIINDFADSVMHLDPAQYRSVIVGVMDHLAACLETLDEEEGE